jgi:hypothetical protein
MTFQHALHLTVTKADAWLEGIRMFIVFGSLWGAVVAIFEHPLTGVIVGGLINLALLKLELKSGSRRHDDLDEAYRRGLADGRQERDSR